MNRTRLILSIGALFVVIVVALWLFFPRTAVSPSATLTLSPPAETVVATSSEIKDVPVNPPKTIALNPLPLAKGDRIVSWDFKGAYTNNPELTAKAQAEIERLSGPLSIATSSAMILSVGIANQYELLGDGKNQYVYLERAVRADALNGLPWHNLGVLMERLGALATARIAYEKSTLVQPQIPMYQYAYLEFLLQYMKDDTAGIEKAFTVAEKHIGSDSYLTYLRDAWKAQ